MRKKGDPSARSGACERIIRFHDSMSLAAELRRVNPIHKECSVELSSQGKGYERSNLTPLTPARGTIMARS
jgi:hypothetical protein